MNLIEVVLHIDQYIAVWSQWMGPWLYVLMFAIIFAETGLVVTPILPGDSLLFALGALTALDGGLSLPLLSCLLLLAAFLGDNTNYFIGKKLGAKLFTKEDSKIFNKSYLLKTHSFYEKYGPKAVILARFVPIVRTFVPFVAGIGAMTWKRFIGFSLVGAILWINIFLFAGHYFGNLPVVKRNFHIVIFAVIGVSVLPIFIEWLKMQRLQKSSRQNL